MGLIRLLSEIERLFSFLLETSHVHKDAAFCSVFILIIELLWRATETCDFLHLFVGSGVKNCE